MKNKRMKWFAYIIIIVFSLLELRLLYVQIIQGDYYKSIVENMAAKAKVGIPIRGLIKDRNMKDIAKNVDSYCVNYSMKTKNDDEINNSLIETVKILYQYNDQSKMILDSLPINYDPNSNSFSFFFKTENPETLDKLSKKFNKDNKLDENLKADETIYALAEKFNLYKKNDDGKLQNTYGISNEILHKVIAIRMAIKGISSSQYKDIYIAKNIKKETFTAIKFKSSYLTGIECATEPMRYYPYGEAGSNFIGYLSKIYGDKEEVNVYKNLGYDVNRELVGRTGLEKLLENNTDLNIKLRGEPEVSYFTVDKYGRILRNIGNSESVPGDTVSLTIDMELQRAAEEALDSTLLEIQQGKYGQKYPNANRGAAVVLDVNTGEILALVSRPGYDPNLFAVNGTIDDNELLAKVFFPERLSANQDKIKAIPAINVYMDKIREDLKKEKDPQKIEELENKLKIVEDRYDVLPKPMYNYALSGNAPPGSTFKPLMAIASLEEGIINKSTSFNDPGVFYVGSTAFYDYHKTSHGVVNVVRALQVSCNFFFFNMGERLGFKKIGEWAYKFGLSSNLETGEAAKTGIELPENVGTVGNPDNYKQRYIDDYMSKITNTLKDAKYGGYNLDRDALNILKELILKDVFSDDDLNTALIKINITNNSAKSFVRSQWKELLAKSNTVGNAVNAAIGQGDTRLTPLQMAIYTATLANGGTRYAAHIIKSVNNPDGTLKYNVEPKVLYKADIKPENVAIVKEGMQKVTERGGTAYGALANYPIKTGAKTGTAQYAGDNPNYFGRSDYAWFIGFAPLDNPKIAVAAVVYDGGSGGYSARVGKKIYDAYFSLYGDNAGNSAQTSTGN